MTFRFIGFSILILTPALLQAGKVDLPEWSEESGAEKFTLGGGLWPDAALPNPKQEFEKLAPLPPGMSREEPNEFHVETERAGEKNPDGSPRVMDLRIPTSINVLSPEDVPNLPTITGELKEEYFSLRPVEYLLDPQQLLTEQKSNDVRRFLEYHADEAEFQIFLMVFGGIQTIPEEVSLPAKHATWFGDEPVVTVAYFLNQPERSIISFSGAVRSSLPEVVFSRIFQSCIREALVAENSSDQVERFAVELSVRLYWMAKLLERQSAGEVIASNESDLSEPWEMDELNEAIPETWFGRVLYRVKALPWGWISLAFGIVLAGLAVGFWIWRRDSTRSKPILFPSQPLPSRLGGEFSGGGYVGISFNLGSGD